MILLLACATAEWTPAETVAPHRQRFDADRDGRFSAAEYQRHTWAAPPFGSVDTDGDGDLSVPEFDLLARTQSAVSFDDERSARTEEWIADGGGTLTADQVVLWEVLLTLVDEVERAGGERPDPDSIAAAVASGTWDSPASRALLTTLRPSWEAHGWRWPLPPG